MRADRSVGQGLRAGAVTVLISFLFSPAALHGQMRPDAPILNFLFPVFAENGYKLWELRGTEGRYLSENEGIILGLDLRSYSADEAMKLENRIRSPEARINFTDTTAQGNSTLFVNGDGFEIEGADWLWDGEARRMTITGGSRVTFFDSINILK